MRSKGSTHISGSYHAVMCQPRLWTGAPVSEGTSEAGRLLSCAVLETLLGRALWVLHFTIHKTRLSSLSLAAHNSPPLSLYTVGQSEV